MNRWRFACRPIAACVALASLLFTTAATGTPASVHFAVARLPNGVSLHYAEQGKGEPVIFVHGSLSNYDYWQDEVPAFARHYRAIAYSRRYDYPNHNAPVAGYSAVTDADDLAQFIRTLHLGRAHIVGHSYGALTALLLAIRHPELVKSITLAEPPAVSLLQSATGQLKSLAATQYRDIEQRVVGPMHRAFMHGDAGRGVGIFIDYVFNNPKAWQTMTPAERAEEMQNVEEWNVMMTRGTLFPDVTPRQVESLRAPVLLLGGTASYPFLITITLLLKSLMPHAQLVWVQGAGHQMWYQSPAFCRAVTEQFISSADKSP